MNCTICNSEIKSKITGDKCTSCFFGSKRNDVVNTPSVDSNPLSDDSIESSPVVLGKPKVDSEDNPEHIPSKTKVTQAPNDGKKYCQSCIERFGNLTLATREWTNGYFICDDCFQPLLSNQLGLASEEPAKVISKITVDSPVLTQIYDILEVPEQLRFNKADKAAMAYNDFFTHHANAIVNLSLEECIERNELLSTIFHTIKNTLHPIIARINLLKKEERAKNHVTSVEKGKKIVTRGKSKVKASKLEKEAKALGFSSVEEYEKVLAQARQVEFGKIAGDKK